MPLKKLPYKNLKTLIGIHLSTKEFPNTLELIKKLTQVKQRKYLKKSELILICKWKSPRTIRLIESNSASIIRNKTKEALKTKSEKVRLDLLVTLQGVSIPMASAILMLTNPQRYGVIDIRVWQLLYAMKNVSENKRGVGFNFQNWYKYLMIIRYFAKMYNVNARDIERTLFNVHRLYQQDNLYR